MFGRDKAGATTSAVDQDGGEDNLLDMASAMTELKRSVHQKQERASKRSKLKSKKKKKKLTKKNKPNRPDALTNNQRAATTGGFLKRTRGLFHSLSGPDLKQQAETTTASNTQMPRKSHQSSLELRQSQLQQQQNSSIQHHPHSRFVDLQGLLSPEKRQALQKHQHHQLWTTTTDITTTASKPPQQPLAKNHFWKAHTKQPLNYVATRSSVADKASLAFLQAVQQKYPSTNNTGARKMITATEDEEAEQEDSHPRPVAISSAVPAISLTEKDDDGNRDNHVDDDDEDYIPGPPSALTRRISSDRSSIPEDDDLSISAHTHDLSLDDSVCGSVASAASSKRSGHRGGGGNPLSKAQQALHQNLVDSWQMLYTRDGIEHELGIRVWKSIKQHSSYQQPASDQLYNSPEDSSSKHRVTAVEDGSEENPATECDDEDRMADRCTFLVEFLDMCVHVFSLSVLAHSNTRNSSSRNNSLRSSTSLAQNIVNDELHCEEDDEDDMNSMDTSTGSNRSSATNPQSSSRTSALRPYTREMQQLGQHAHRLQLAPELLPESVLKALNELWAYTAMPEKERTVQLWKDTLNQVVPRMKILVDNYTTNGPE